VNRDRTEADKINLEVDSNERSVIFKEETVGGRERVTTYGQKSLAIWAPPGPH